MQNQNFEQGPRMGEFQSPQVFEQHGNPMGDRISMEFVNFLQQYELSKEDPNFDAYQQGLEDESAKKFYIGRVQQMIKNEKNALFIDYQHMTSHQFSEANFLDKLLQDYQRYESYLRKGLMQFVESLGHQVGKQTLYQVGIYNMGQIGKIRDLKTFSIGKLMSVEGTVTRTTEVKPELQIGSFKCQQCNSLLEGIEQQFKFTEPLRCVNEKCLNLTQWELTQSNSIFLDWQKVRLQELSSDIPAGSMPRSIDVILRGDIVDEAKPGDRTIFTGSLVVVPDIVQLLKVGEKQQITNMDNKHMPRNTEGKSMDGITGLARVGVKDLSYKMVFVANSVHAHDSRFGQKSIDDDDELTESEIANQFNQAERQLVSQLKSEDDLYSRMSAAIAPQVHGQNDVKKGLLLQLFSGVHKKTSDGIKLRGDLNVCIVGDPATAKSQFLRYICRFLPRSVYTSGKTSSAAGLTASVARDRETGEFCIEAGALMLADHGICCIDEFDKMDPRDQTAIHEAMEQQTISIAKAGIHATLNARTSILAAANPVHGRYDRTRSLNYNVNISPPIMSRFDLFFVVCDEKRDEDDFNIARHIVNMHRMQEAALQPEFSTADLQTYIKVCRTFKPQFTRESAEILKEQYKELRQADKGSAFGPGQSMQHSYRYTVRQLESLVRLSEAMARVHADDIIRPSYVKEVCRLLKASNINLVKRDLEFAELQEGINEERREERKKEAKQADEAQNIQVEPSLINGQGFNASAQPADLFEMDEQAKFRASQAAANASQRVVPQVQEPVVEQPKASNKVKITYDEYKKYAIMVTGIIKDMERSGQDSVVQSDVVNKLVQKLELEDGAAEGNACVERTIQTTKKIQNVIQHLITKENVLMVTQDARVKNERMLCVNINVEMDNMVLGGQ